MSLFFDAGKIGTPNLEYVAWIDVMGTQSSMSILISAAANFISKLHTAAILATKVSLRLYPVMDGFYMACKDQDETLSFLRSVFTQTADEFNLTTKDQHRFMVRGGLAFGPIYHGSDINQNASQTLYENSPYRDSLLMGMPMIQAYLVESQAPPFGLFVHESARAFAPQEKTGIPHAWWKWVDSNNEQSWSTLKAKLPLYMQWCEEHSMFIGYSKERISAHKEMVSQFFA